MNCNGENVRRKIKSLEIKSSDNQRTDIVYVSVITRKLSLNFVSTCLRFTVEPSPISWPLG